MGFIINPFMVAAAGGATTTKVKVNLAAFDEDDGCACSLSGTLEIWEDSFSGLGPSVNDWISGQASSSSTVCAKVIAINQTASAVGYTTAAYSDCAACNDATTQCEDLGGGP